MTPPIEGTKLTSKNIKNLTDEELVIAQKEYQNRIGANLAAEKQNIPQLEDENYKIDKGMSTEEKLKNGWKKEKQVTVYVNGKETQIGILKKDLGNGAYIWEYLDGPTKGEQLFNRFAVQKLGLDKKLPTWKDIQKIGHANLLEKFKKGNKFNFPGYWSEVNDGFSKIGGLAGIFLAGADGGERALFNEECIYRTSYIPEVGFSVRLLKK